jgi:hypothetical protein
MQSDNPITMARVDDLDLDDPKDAAEWDRRLAALAKERLEQARARLQKMGVIDETGAIVSDEEPAEMDPARETSVETG